MTSPTPHDTNLPETLEEDTLRWLFGDGEEDPGPLVDLGAKTPAMDAWLDRFERDYRAMKSSITSQDSEALARLAALREEIRRRRENPIVWPAVDNIRSLDAARMRSNKRRNGVVIGGVILAIAAAALFIVNGIGRGPREVDAQMANNLVKSVDSLNAPGFGFAGESAPSARDRGFLLGAIADLARPRKATGQTAEAEMTLARELTDRALAGLEAPEDPNARVQRALGGCGAILSDPNERAACESGFADYLKRRDAY
jgi:hypothetical protein